MTDPIDDGDDEYGWDRGGARPAGRPRRRGAPEEDSGSMSERLARLRDGLDRGGARRAGRRSAGGLGEPFEEAPQERRQERHPERHPERRPPQSQGRGLPDALDRAIDRVGDVFGGAERADIVRDPYADQLYGDQEYDEGAAAGGEAGYDAAYDEYESAPEPRRRARAEPDPEELAEREAMRGGGRQDRRAARTRKRAGAYEASGAYGFDPAEASEAPAADYDAHGYEEESGRADPRYEADYAAPRGREAPRDYEPEYDERAYGRSAGYEGRREPASDPEEGLYPPGAAPRFSDEPHAGGRAAPERRGADPFDDPIDLDRFDSSRPGADPGPGEIPAPAEPATRRARADDPRAGDFRAGELRAGDLEDEEPEIDFAFDDRAREAEPRRRRRRSGGLRARDVEPELETRDRRGGGGRIDPQMDARFDGRGLELDDVAPAAAAAARGQRGRGSSPFGSLERLLAGRYLRARRKEGFISVIAMLSLIGITLAVAVLIVVMSVMNGFRAELIDKMVGVNGHLIVTPLERNFEDYAGAAKAIRAVPGVTRAAPLIEAKAFASSPRGGEGVIVRGVSKSDLLTLEEIAVSPERSVGDLSRFGEGDGVAIGSGLAQRLGVTVGDSISLLSPKGSATPIGMAPRRRVFDVDYIFKMGMSNYDDVLVFMPIRKAQGFFGRGGLADYIEVKVATPDKLDGYAQDIESAVGRPIAITSWMENNGLFIGALETEQSVMFLILSMLILIASLIIISGLIMLVKEKGTDIAILRTMGLSRGGVMRVFFMCGATVGVLGAALGVALGVVVAINVDAIKVFVEELTGARLFPSEIYQFSALPSRLDWSDVSFTVAITLGLSFLATLYPAWRAARLDPVEALRYE